MRAEHTPVVVVPESNLVVWSEYDHPELQTQETVSLEFGGTYPGDDSFAPEVVAWLDENTPGWSVQWDRGDFGDGSLSVRLSMLSQDDAARFVGRWGGSAAA
jgi:hypothetical protein